MTGATERWMETGGQRSRLLSAGEGNALLFLHGAGGVHGWIPFLAELERDFHVLHPEHPGFGLSPEDGTLSTVADLADHYAEFIRTLQLSDIHLVGSSFGGWLAAELALRVPERLRSLTLMAPVGIVARPQATAAPQPGEEAYWRRLFASVQAADAMIASLDAARRAQNARSRQAAARLAGPQFHDARLAARLTEIALPTLLLWGDRDLLAPVSQASLWLDRLPDARLECIARCGHLPHFELPLEAAAQIRAHARAASAKPSQHISGSRNSNDEGFL